jgi:predicted kinase
MQSQFVEHNKKNGYLKKFSGRLSKQPAHNFRSFSSAMQAIIFIGIQGSGKTSFYKERFLKTHVRISLDLLKTRGKEIRFLQLCLETGQKFVIDNTNPNTATRTPYIEAARRHRFQVVGYYFNTDLHEALARNSQRAGKEVVSIAGVRATYKKLQRPRLQEGFDKLFEVTLIGSNFEVQELV